MIRIVTLNTNRSEYDIRDAAACSITVGELIEELESNYNKGDKIVFSNDNGYTYGYVTEDRIAEHNVETHEEEEEREITADIQFSYSGDALYIGDKVTLSVSLTGAEPDEVSIQWQTNGGSGWQDVSGATGTSYTFKLTESNYRNEWRVAVTPID